MANNKNNAKSKKMQKLGRDRLAFLKKSKEGKDENAS